MDEARALAWDGPEDPGDWQAVTRTFSTARPDLVGRRREAGLVGTGRDRPWWWTRRPGHPAAGQSAAAEAAILHPGVLEAPEGLVPRSLMRADGRSIYQRHGGVRYATHAQLSLEERMLALARGSAPRRA